MSTIPPPTFPATGSDAFTYYLLVASGSMAPQMGLVVEFASRVDEVALARALRLLLDTEPVLGYRFVADSPGPLWERVELGEDGAVLRVEVTSDPEAAAHAFLASPFDARTDPQVRGRLLRAPDHDALALQVSHVAVDGRGSVEALYRLCELHRTLAERPDWEPPFNSRSIRDFARAGVPASIVEKATSMKAFASTMTASEWPFPDSGKRGGAAYTLASLDPTLLAATRQAARTRGATVNDVLLTAYYQALRRVLKPGIGAKTPVSIGADLRAHLSIGEGWGLSNFAAMLGVPLSAAAQDDFDYALARIQEETQALKSTTLRQLAVSRALSDGLTRGRRIRMWRPMFRAMGAAAKKAMDSGDAVSVPVLTNLGEIDSAKVRFGGDAAVARVRWFVQPGSGGAIPLGAATFRGRLELCMSVDPNTIDPDVPHRIVDGTVREIEAWISAPAAF